MENLLETNESIAPQKKISTFGKVWRIGLLWLTCPIWITLRAIIKTLATIRKWSICRMRTVWSGLKSKWALAGEKKLVDIKWYETKNFITFRKIIFPIDLAIHIVIGLVIAPFKFIKSFVMGFRTAARITKDIYSDNANEHAYSNGDCLASIPNLFRAEKNTVMKC